jgi:2-polyprenyl-6-methoxyphenol hydroxylase-like FAD-dependent oxidoreductase
VAGGEQLLGVDGELGNAALHRSLVGAAQARAVGGEDQDRLPEHGQVTVPRAVDVGLADQLRPRSRDAADQERGHVRLLPHGKVVAQHDRELRIELHGLYSYRRRLVDYRAGNLSSEEMRIVCVGGGPAGLYFSILMKARDPAHEVTVLERSPAGVTYGWGVVFWDDLLDEVRASDPPTARELGAQAFRWHGEQLVVADQEPVYVQGQGYGIGRQLLLDLLHERAAGLGVDVRFEEEVEDPSELPDADLIVACDGVNSRLRQLRPDRYATDVEVGRNKYIWLGTTKVFDVFTFAFVPTAAGWIWCHAYAFDRETSTFIVECSPETWSGLGFDQLGETESLELLAKLFQPHLDGRPLQAKGPVRWLEFRTLTNECWRHENVVLMGDAAHTTHFTIGSGTKLALEDAIALADELQDGQALERALEAYERKRKVALRPRQTDARFSARWFEDAARYAELDPIRVFALMHERRSPLLPRIPPALYYRLHQATHDVAALRRLRRFAAPRIKALYGR